MNDQLLKVTSLEARYGAVCALDGVSMDICRGEAVAVLGSNGAGKTTLLRSLSGLLKTVRGQVSLNGKHILGTAPHIVAKHGLLHVPEGRQVFARMTVEENLLIGGYRAKSNGLENRSRLDEVYEIFPRLWERKQQHAGTMSGGEQQMLAIGRALVGEPELLMLDEPSMGLAPAIVDTIFDALEVIKARTSLLIVEQNAERALGIADRVYLLQSGRVVHHCRSEELTDDLLSDTYFGTH